MFQSFCFSQNSKYENEKYVIVLDVQQYYTDNCMPKKDADEMVKSINSLIGKTNPEKVIYVKSLYGAVALSISFKGFKIDTIPANEFDKNLVLINNTIFNKTDGNAFLANGLLEYLKQKGVKDIIVTGLLAERCVTKTTQGGISSGFNIYLLSDAIGGKSNRSKAKAIKKLVKMGAKQL